MKLLIQTALRALPLMAANARQEALSIIASLDPAAAPYEVRAARAAADWEDDMRPVRAAVAATLHCGNTTALQGLRALLPGLLRSINEAPSLAVSLARMMAWSVETGPTAAANAAVTFSEDHVVSEALTNWRSRTVMETDLGSAELRGFSAEIRNRSLFSARTTNAEYLREVGHVVDGILSGDVGMAEGRWLLMRKLKELGYNPATGFPDDYSAVPPAERDSLQDLSSRRRLDLLLETNVRMAQGYAMVLNGNTEGALYAYPAYQLVRLYHRDHPRGTPESKSVGWERRWSDAGESILWEGALPGQAMIARKDSPIWKALGDGAGGYTDTLLNPFPPFAFRSGKAWKSRSRADCIALGLVEAEETPAPLPAQLTPGQREVVSVVDTMPPDLRAELARELGLAS